MPNQIPRNRRVNVAVGRIAAIRLKAETNISTHSTTTCWNWMNDSKRPAVDSCSPDRIWCLNTEEWRKLDIDMIYDSTHKYQLLWTNGIQCNLMSRACGRTDVTTRRVSVFPDANRVLSAVSYAPDEENIKKTLPILGNSAQHVTQVALIGFSCLQLIF